MWVEFKVKWQDGLYKYKPGMVVNLPTVLARGYCESGKAKRSKPAKWAVQEERNKPKEWPSARKRLKKMRTSPKQEMSISELAEALGED